MAKRLVEGIKNAIETFLRVEEINDIILVGAK